jgi:hypothetical protein
MKTTIEDIIVRLGDIVDETVRDNSLWAVFAVVYHNTTINVRNAIAAGRFRDGARMERLDVHFAQRYIAAYDAYRAGTDTTQAWRIAFDAGTQRLTLMQHLMLGMNAHINLDLGVAAAEVMPAGQVGLLEEDFFVINGLLSEQIEVMQVALGKVSPLLVLLDVLGQRGDERFAEFSIKNARAFAWANARSLTRITDAARPAAYRQLDGEVALFAKLILRPGRFVGWVCRIIARFESRDMARVVARLREALPTA